MQPAHGTKVCLSKSSVQESIRVMKGLLLVLKVIKITRGRDKLRYDRKKYAFNTP